MVLFYIISNNFILKLYVINKMEEFVMEEFVMVANLKTYNVRLHSKVEPIDCGKLFATNIKSR